MKTEKKSKTPYREMINTHVPSGWCIHSTFAYGDDPNPLQMYHGKVRVENFKEYIEDKVKQVYTTFQDA